VQQNARFQKQKAIIANQIQEMTGSMIKWMYRMLFIFSAQFSFAQKQMVQLILEPKVAEVGEEITVTVKTNIRGDLDLDFPSAFVQGNNIMNGMESQMDQNSGKMITYYFYSLNGVISKEGTFPFCAFIKKGSTLFKSNKVFLKIERPKQYMNDEVSTKQLRKAAFGIIGKSKNKIYEGEPVVLVSKVYARFTPTNLDSHVPYEMEGAIEKHELGSSENISLEQKTVNGVPLLYFECDKKVIFTSKIGRVLISPFKINLKNDFDSYSFTSNSTYIDVMPLPENPPADFIGGVGDFSVKRSISKKSLSQGDVLVMTVVVTGEGNLHNTSPPKVELPKGFVVYGDPVIKEEYTFGTKGSVGSIKYEYNIQVEEKGNTVIPQLSLSYFDLTAEKYITLTSKAERITVLGNANLVTQTQPSSTKIIQDESLQNVQDELLTEKEDGFFKSTPFIVLTIISPFFVAFLFLMRRKKNRKEPSTVVVAEKVTIDTNKGWNELDKANKKLDEGENDAFFHALYQAIFIICSASIKNNNALHLNKSDLLEAMQMNHTSKDRIIEVQSIFTLCEEARYGFEQNSDLLQLILDKTNNVLKEFSSANE
jgi:hypothetical protein